MRLTLDKYFVCGLGAVKGCQEYFELRYKVKRPANKITTKTGTNRFHVENFQSIPCCTQKYSHKTMQQVNPRKPQKKIFPFSEINDCDLEHIPSCCSKLLTVSQHTCTFVTCCLCSHLRPTNQLQLNITKSQSHFSIFFSSSSVFSSHIHVLNNWSLDT